jgi:hypothetical protein
LELELRLEVVQLVFCAVPCTLHLGAASRQERGKMRKIRGFISFEFEVHASRPRAGQAWRGRAGMHAQEQAGCVEQGRRAGRQTAKIQEGPRREQHLKP